MSMRYPRLAGSVVGRLAFLVCGVVFAQGLGEGTGDGRGGGAAAADGSAAGAIRPVLPVRREPWIQPGSRGGVDWRGLAWQSNLFLGVEHAFRLATEPGTRAGLRGPFLGGWMSAAGNLHGWADGDPFYVNYVGHPMQGAVTGFIWTHNDRGFRGAELGANSFYWKSRLRAAAYSWAYSTLFEIGPASEASIGKVQRVDPQQGFVDHVVTPVIGTGWLVAEDALDKYLIRPLEARVESPLVRILARGALNPARSFANLMALRPPWARDERPDVFSPLLSGYVEDLRAGRIRTPRLAPREWDGRFGLAPLEVASSFQWQVIGGQPCAGGGGQAAFRLSPAWQLVVDVSGCRLLGLEKNRSGDALTYVAGPRWSARPVSRWSPYAHVLLGGMKVTGEQHLPEARAVRTWEANGFAVAAGTGLDLRLMPALALRLANLEYRRAWLPPVTGREYSAGLAFTVGAVLRMGTW